ncbi:hypothetical protein D1164_13605 [Mariniphaga sediminis]|jgi:hypothetical protein|uniref:Uncharacterized protein n=1 Tax=Mariniphaga sediminis TaxID=1628158 RepID=A0A399D1W0_9BACT|nr:hypothetical protein D1164_13605 [Mariniphaga sediminis]
MAQEFVSANVLFNCLWSTLKVRWSSLFSDTFSINIFMPYQADFTLWFSQKDKQKPQGCVRFTRKSYLMRAVSKFRQSG